MFVNAHGDWCFSNLYVLCSSRSTGYIREEIGNVRACMYAYRSKFAGIEKARTGGNWDIDIGAVI